MTEVKTVTPETRAYVHGLIVGTLRLAGDPGLNAARIHAALMDQVVTDDWTLQEIIAELPSVSGIAREHNPFVGSMARWSLTPSES
jgi:hypothetical protein